MIKAIEENLQSTWVPTENQTSTFPSWKVSYTCANLCKDLVYHLVMCDQPLSDQRGHSSE